MIFEFSQHFKKAYAELPEPTRKKVNKTLELLENNPRRPSLHIEKIDFKRNIWSGRVNRNHRFTFQWIPGGICLRKVGPHQKVYRNI